MLALDAKESIVQRNFRRLESLESNMEKLFKAIADRYAPSKKEENQDTTTTSVGPNGPAVASAFAKSLKTFEVDRRSMMMIIIIIVMS